MAFNNNINNDTIMACLVVSYLYRLGHVIYIGDDVMINIYCIKFSFWFAELRTDE